MTGAGPAVTTGFAIKSPRGMAQHRQPRPRGREDADSKKTVNPIVGMSRYQVRYIREM